MAKNDWSGSFHLGQGIAGSQPNFAGGTTQGTTGNALVDGLISGSKWNSTSLTYSFPWSSTQFNAAYVSQESAPSSGFQAFNAEMITAARATFAELSFYSNLSFTEQAPTTDPTSVDITLARTSSSSSAFAYYPSNSQLGGDAWFGLDASISTPVRGTYGWVTMLHELGHSMGLKHGHEAGGVAGAVTSARDAMEFSLMSYRSYVGAGTNGAYSNEQFSYAQTFMMLDIAALQAMYGADYTSNQTDSVYTFNALSGQMLINGVGEFAPGGNRIFRTVWDGGGVDTYDYSNYSNAQNISLAAGRWSMFSSAQRADLGDGNFSRGNVYNAMQVGADERSLIENANAGSGNDTVEGNQVANVLNGNAGSDTIHGQGGNDTINGGIGNDTLYGDFLPAGVSGPPLPGPTYTLGSGYLTTSAASYVSIGTALSVMSNFSFAADADIANATTIAHTTVNVTQSGATANFYSVVLNAGNRLMVDIDRTITGGYDSYIELRDAQGGVLSDNDDAGLDPGSDSDSQDSYLSFTASSAGTYYVVVGRFANQGFSPTFSNALTQYEVNISIENSAPFSEQVGNLGLAGNDILDGGAGSDTLIGGDGNEIYYVDSAGDVISETNADQVTGGFDIVIASASYTLSANVEQLVLQGGATSGTGNAGANILYGLNSGLALSLSGLDGDDVIYGSSAGGNTLNGGSGVDTILMYGGSNVANGGLGSDIYYTYTATDVISEAGGDGVDTVYANWNFTLGAGIEQVLLFGSANTAVGSVDNNIIYGNSTSGAVSLFGNGGSDVLYGGAGSDTLNGGAGVDLLFGQGGANTLIGGDDTDIYYFDGGTNTVTETATGGFDTIYSNNAGTTTLAANVEQLILYGAATGGTGTSGNDFIYANGTSGAATLNGGAGNDYLLGSAFNDVLTGGEGNDEFELSTGGNDSIRYNAAGNMGTDFVYNFDADPTGGQDLIDLTGHGYNAGAVGSAITMMSSGGDTLISFNAGGSLAGTTVTLVGVSVANVTADDFVF